MGSFGDRLRREREQRGITLEDIALTTKIRAGLLQALEEEKFDRLPGGIFNKGFVRAYARHLGLDEDQLIADYLVASGEGPVRKPGDSQSGGRPEIPEPRIQLVRDEPESDARTGKSLSTRGMLAGLLVLVVVGAVAWFYYHREKHAEAVPPPQPALTAPSEPAAGSPSSSAASSPAATPPAPADATPQPAPQTAVPAARPSAPATVQPSPAPVQTGVPAQTNAAPASAFTVHVKADEDCWAQITVDGKSEEITMEAGFEKLLTAKSQITIRAGSVGALDLAFNGTKLPSQGDYGQVKTLLFNSDGLQPPAPKPINPPPPALQ